MQPDTNTPQPPPPNQAPVAPQPLPAAPPTQPMVTPPIQSFNTATAAAPKSKKAFIIIAAILGLVLVALGLLWFFIFSPAAQAAKASQAFMTAASQNDVDKLLVLNDDQSGETRGFLEGVGAALEGKFKLLEKKSKDGSWYFLYELEGADSKYARTVVQKKDGKWVVISIVHSKEKLSVIPNESEPSEQTTTDEPTTSTSASPVPQACLVQEDYYSMNYDPKLEDTVIWDTTYAAPNETNFTNNKTDSMFFEPNSIKETTNSGIYDDWARFATQNSNKQWKFRLQGAVYQAAGSTYADAASVELANNRAQEVKRELVSRGVPEDRFILDKPIEHTDEYLKGFEAEIYRRVEVLVDPTCSAR